MNIRLSHSALETFLTCERMFQLDRLLEGASEKQDYPSTVFGKAYGVGVSTYFLTQDKDKALFAAYLEYWPVLEEEGKKTEETLLNLLIVTFPKLDNLMMDWEVAVFEDRPAIELSFRLNNLSESEEHNIYFVGYVDLVIKNKWTGRYAILEVKTTGLGLMDISPLYRNSGQALGYSIILDRIAGKENSEYDVLYLVGQLNTRTAVSIFSPTIHINEFPKSIQDRLNWFIALGMDVQRLVQMLTLNVFPLRGGSCLQYMRPCKHFSICSLQGLDRYKEIPEDTKEYQFVYDLQELVESHLERSY